MNVAAKVARSLSAWASASNFGLSIRSTLLSLFVLLQALVRVDKDSDDVGVLRAAPGAADHGAVEPAAWGKDAGRINKNELRHALDGDAADERAGGLHFRRDDGDLGADERVEQRRLAGIRRADQRNKAAMRVRGRCLSHWHVQT
jgi:hypothetical protein